MIETGAKYLGVRRCRFTVWAPEKETMVLHIVSPTDKKIAMEKDTLGYFTVELDDIEAGSHYYYMPDGGGDCPDPCSYYQPEGVHGPSEVVDHDDHVWTDIQWKGMQLKDLVLYELHIGTFTPEGTFEAAIRCLDDLLETGVNAIEIMPISQFPGDRNWGYDGVLPYAAQNTYGGPRGLKKLVDACHAKGIAVYLDVVYNHFGPEGNVLTKFAPYFTDRYTTLWGDAINFDGPYSDGVREYFCNNAIYWLRHFHIDGLRLDAIHGMYDFGAVHFWELLHDAVEEESRRMGRQLYLIAESDLNNPKIIKHPEAGGYGFNAQWLDDFHHALYTLINKADRERFFDFGSVEQLSKAYVHGFVHSGEYTPFRKRKYGASTACMPGDRFIVFNQNHDQVGNRADGARLATLINFELQKVAAAALLLSPYVPMLFMGEEYGEDNPFHYFVSHTDPELVNAVKAGRKKEFEAWHGNVEPADPQSEKTFAASKLSWGKRVVGNHKNLLGWNKMLIALRKKHAAMQSFSKDDIQVYIISDGSFGLHRRSADGRAHLFALFNISDEPASWPVAAPVDGLALIADSRLGAGPVVAQQVLKRSEYVAIPGAAVFIYSNRERN